MPARRRTSNDTTRNRVVPFVRSLSCNASSNDSQLINRNSTSNSNSPSTLSKSPVVADVSRTELEERNAKNALERQLPSGQAIRTRWNNHADREFGSRTRRRRRNVNASTQTLSTVDELDGAGTADCPDLTGVHTNDEQAEVRISEGDVDKDDVQSCVTDILRSMLEPDRRTSRLSDSSTTFLRCRHPHHHHHRHQQYSQRQHQHHQRRLNEINYNQSNRHPVHSYPSACSSCNMRQSDFQDPVVIRSTRGSLPDSHHGSFPRCISAVRGRPVISERRSPAATSSTPISSSSTPSKPPPSARPAESAASARRGRLTEEALRQRIERVLVEMVARNDDEQESKVAAALRQAIVDSAAFPTLFTD